MEEKEKNKRILKEKKRLKEILKSIETDKMKSVESLIGNAAFMRVTLEELQETILKEGTVSEYKNGENQYGTKKSPEVEIYNTMVKNYMACIKQITDLLPKNDNNPLKDDGFEDFINSK